MPRSRANGATDVSEYFVIRDSTNHAPKTDVTITDIDIYYQEQGAAQSAKADLTALDAADSAHADNKGYNCGNALYRVDFPDAAFDGGAGKTVILVVVCTGCDTIYREILLSPPVGAAASVTGAVGSVTGAVGSVTAGVTLADDAITAAKFDESTAFPLKSADTGATAVARPGDEMDLVDAPNATAVTAIKDAVQAAGTTLATLLSRLVGTIAAGTHNAQTGDAYARLGAPAGASVSTDIADLPTNTELEARTLAAASYFDPSTDEVDVGAVKGVAVTSIDDFKADVSGLSTLTEEDLPSEPPSAATIATAVWAAVERTLTAFGFEVEATVDEEALAAAIVAAIGDEGLVDETALANAVVAALGALTVTITSPVAADGTITIYQESDYYATEGRSIPVEIEDPLHRYQLDAEDAVVQLRLPNATFLATSRVETDEGYTCHFEPTSAQTAALTTGGDAQVWGIMANGRQYPLRSVRATLVRAVAEAVVEEST